MKNWILAKVISNGETKGVRQNEPGGRFWMDVDDNIYDFCDLDFTEVQIALPCFSKQNAPQMPDLNDIMLKLDVKAQDDHRAVITAREYWRKLRGEVFMMLYQDTSARQNWSVKSKDDLLNETKYIINQLFEQDKDFTLGKISAE